MFGGKTWQAKRREAPLVTQLSHTHSVCSTSDILFCYNRVSQRKEDPKKEKMNLWYRAVFIENNVRLSGSV